MIKDATFRRWMLGIALPVFAALLAIFFVNALYAARQKPLWTDEHYTIKHLAMRNSYSHLFWHGPFQKNEGSPSPFYTLLTKWIYNQRTNINWAGFHPLVYFRLISIAATLLLTIFIVILMGCAISQNTAPPSVKTTQILLLLLATVCLLFQPFVYAYAIEARPYVLWDLLWMAALTLTLTSNRRGWGITVLLLLMAFTTTGSIFQIAAMASAFIILRWNETTNWKTTLSAASRLFIAPALLCVYYFPWGAHWEYPQPPNLAELFFRFWNNERPTALLSVLGIVLCFQKKETRIFALASLSMLLLYFFEPLMTAAVVAKKYFLHNRQFLFNELSVPVFLLTLARCLPGGFDPPGKKTARAWGLSICLFSCAALFYTVDVHTRLTTAVKTSVAHFTKPENRQALSVASASAKEIYYWEIPENFWVFPENLRQAFEIEKMNFVQ
ncbi:MAG: hypothetical protein HQL23_06985 [Candidatus Omnitrophica bacterium]|nr:hypothetical protein [Candidatus Omnitrophota bacterium]